MTRRSDGRWVETLTVTIDGRPVRKYFYGNTKKEVLLKIAAYEEEAENGPLWQDLCDVWWEHYRPTVAYNTLKPIAAAYRRAREVFPGVRARNITPSMIMTCMERLCAKNHMAHKTAATQLSVFRMAGKHGIITGALTENPAKDLPIPTGLKKERRELPSAKDIAATKAYNGTGSMGAMFAYWAMYTGLRKGELLGLTWEDINLETREIYVRRSIYHDANKPIVKSPKTEAGVRVAPIVDKLAAVMKPGKGIVFNIDGKYLSETQYRKMWGEFQAETGVECTAHQLRHVFATMLLEANIPTEQARIILGHTDTATTERIYQHIREELRRREISKIRNLDIL